LFDRIEDSAVASEEAQVRWEASLGGRGEVRVRPNGAVGGLAVPGATAVVEWLGGWTFHDFELLALPPPGAKNGTIQIRGWVTDWHATDERGFFKRCRFCVIAMALGGIRSASVEGEELPAIIFGLEITPTTGQFWRVEWTSSYGVEGAYEAETVSLSLVPEDKAGTA
jgi:hypothetical protein